MARGNCIDTRILMNGRSSFAVAPESVFAAAETRVRSIVNLEMLESCLAALVISITWRTSEKVEMLEVFRAPPWSSG
jgi:hypothetical protein